MMPTIAIPDVRLLNKYDYIGKAKHTEEERILDMYKTESGAILLQDYMVDGFLVRSKQVLLPPHSHSELAFTIWEHFKSTPDEPKLYTMHGIGTDIYRLERLVLYTPRYESGLQRMREQGVSCLARPEAMFFSEVERDGYKGPRFKRIK